MQADSLPGEPPGKPKNTGMSSYSLLQGIFPTQGSNPGLHITGIFFTIELPGKPFRYELNQIPYDYTVKVTNRFKGLDLIDRVPEELWGEVCNIVQEAVIKTIHKQTKCKKEK